MDEHAAWRREWQGGGETTVVTIRTSEEFSSAPSVSEPTETELVIAVEVRATSKWWKDFVVQMIHELRQAFPGTSLVRIDSSDNASR
jgi:hypothetical protein